MDNLGNYYNRSENEAEKGYERHLFRAGYILQSAELNEIQEYSVRRHRALGDALFKDGDIVRDARVIVDSATGEVIAEAGAVYLDGSVRGVPPATFTIPLTGTVPIGIYLSRSVVTELEDTSLAEPAVDVQAYGEPGAAREMLSATWGAQSDQSEGFYPIYYVDDGKLRAKEAPPQLDSVTQAISKYDRDSTGSSYIVSGLNVSLMDDTPSGAMVYSVQDGRARVNGFGINLNTSRRIERAPDPDLRAIDSEPHISAGSAAQRITLDRTPIDEISQVRITAEKAVTLVHGTFAGATDPLPDTSVVDIISCVQGGTTYVKGTDYKLTAGRVDWSLDGDEPAPGSSYIATYQYITSVEPTLVDSKGFTVEGAVSGTLVLTNYTAKLPRIDRLCLDERGLFIWVYGVATDYNPVRPQVPSNLMPLCQVVQTWDADTRRLIADGVRMVSMSDIQAISSRLDVITDLVAQQKLISNVSVREQAAKKGVFVDPFINDEQRDAGQAQTAAVFAGVLTLPINGSAGSLSADVIETTSCAHVLSAVLEQTSRTGAMKINPYMAFSIIPAKVQLNPAVDRWTETVTSWTSSVTQQFTAFAIGGTHDLGSSLGTSFSTTTSLVSASSSLIQNLRQIDVRFEAAGFGPGETLTSITFDGIPVVPTAV